MIPKSFEEWQECIVVKCGIPLTVDYLRERSRTLKDASTTEVKKFRELYGDAHWQKVVSWFDRALEDLRQEK